MELPKAIERLRSIRYGSTIGGLDLAAIDTMLALVDRLPRDKHGRPIAPGDIVETCEGEVCARAILCRRAIGDTVPHIVALGEWSDIWSIKTAEAAKGGEQ